MPNAKGFFFYFIFSQITKEQLKNTTFLDMPCNNNNSSNNLNNTNNKKMHIYVPSENHLLNNKLLFI